MGLLLSERISIASCVPVTGAGHFPMICDLKWPGTRTCGPLSFEAVGCSPGCCSLLSHPQQPGQGPIPSGLCYWIQSFYFCPSKNSRFDFVATYCFWFSDCASQTSSISTWELFRSENAGTPPWTFSERNFGMTPSNPVLTRRSSQMWEPLLLWYGKLHSEHVTSLFPLLVSLPRASQHVYLCPSILGLLQQHQLVP